MYEIFNLCSKFQLPFENIKLKSTLNSVEYGKSNGFEEQNTHIICGNRRNCNVISIPFEKKKSAKCMKKKKKKK